MKNQVITKTQIREQLVKVFSNAALTTIYNSQNEQYTGLCALLLHRAATATTAATATAINATTATARRVWHWLTTVQDFSNEEGEIHMTGARYICVCSLVCLVLLLIACIGD